MSAASLVAPNAPSRPIAASEHFEVGPGAARLDPRVLLIGFTAVLALAGGDGVHLPPPRRQRAGVLAAHAEEQDFSHVA